MNYFELLLCRYTWFWTKAGGYKRAGSYEFTTAVCWLILLIFCWPIAHLCVYWGDLGYDKDDVKPLSYIVGILYVVICIALNVYYDRIMKTRRIVYNIEYMRSKNGTVLAISFALLSFGQIFLWPLILR